MQPNYQPQRPQRGLADDLKGGFATTAAAMVSMIVAPAFNGLTAPYVIWLAQENYSPDVVEFIGLAWMILAYPFVFFAARAGIGASLTAAGVYLAYRFI